MTGCVLIVSLGLMHELQQRPVLVSQAFIINRVAGIPYPLWRSRKQSI